MVSKAIASLDAWLVSAEAVLAEQREHGLSPTLGMLKEHDSYEWTLTFGRPLRRPGNASAVSLP
jgi:hypothetical protein